MKRRFTTLARAFFVLALLPGTGRAQSGSPPTKSSFPPPVTMNLEDCERKAAGVAPSIQAASADEDVVRAKLSQAKAAFFLPEVKVNVLGGVVPDLPPGLGPSANFPNVDTDLGEWGPFIQTRVTGVQPVFTFGKLSNLKAAAEIGVDAKRAQGRAARNEVLRNVRKAYYGVVALLSTKDFLEELQDRAGSARDRVEELLRKHSGEVTDIDLMRMDVFSAETERNMAEIRNGIEFGMVTLGILTGGLGSAPVAPADKALVLREVPIGPVDTYISRARAVRPEVRQLDDLVAVKRALMKASKADFFPAFFLGGFYNFAWAPDREGVHNPYLKDDFNFNTGGGGLGLEQKLSFHMTNAKYDEAQAEYRKAIRDRETAMIGIELEIRRAHSEATAKSQAARSAREGFRAGRSWVTASTLNFGVGLVPVKDLLEAFLAYSRVKLGYLNTIHDYVLALVDLSRAVGEEIGEAAK